MLLLPSVKKAPAPRIICTTSCLHYAGHFNLANANSGKESYENNKLYFQIWLAELQSRMMQKAEYKHITIHGVHPGYVRSNIWQQDPKSGSMSPMEWVLRAPLKYLGIDTQQGSLAITHTATSPEWGCKTGRIPGGSYSNRIWQQEAMPHAKDPICRRAVWEFVAKELKLQERGLLNDLGV